jgi:hypothetical protein
MTYKYHVIIAGPVANQDNLPGLIENECNYQGKQGFRLVDVKAINNFMGVAMTGQPKMAVSYQLLFEQSNKDNDNGTNDKTLQS